MIERIVLLFEDNPNDEALALRALKKSGVTHRVRVVRDGREGLDYLFREGSYSDRRESEIPCMVLLDLNLPKIGGLDVLRSIRAHERTQLLPVVILTSSGEERDLLAGYIAHPDGRRIAYALAFDNTEAKLRDQQLAQVQKMEAVGKLTGGIAHDFNNLLAIIHGNAEFLRERATDPDSVEFADEVLAASGRGADLVRRLMAFCRQQELKAEAVDLTERLPEVIGLLRRTLGERIAVKTVVSRDLWHALTDPAQVDDALVNLAINARDAMPEGGTLTIETANVFVDEDYIASHADVSAGEYVMLAVSDTGTGMPADVVARACEPFFTTKEMDRGTGLGLSQIYGWTKQSGGHLNIYSEVGKGTTIKLYLPRAQDPASIRAARPAQESPVGNETVLVVEDNSEVRRVAVRQLRELGYDTIEACDAEEALELVHRGVTFDLLFSDVIMPGNMTGYDLARSIRKKMPNIRILFASGYTALVAQDSNGGMELGSLISKPYPKHELARALRHALENADPIFGVQSG